MIINRLEEDGLRAKLLILIISPPGDLQIGLQALLTTHLDVDVLAVSKESSALKVIERQNPALVILDQDNLGNTATMVHNIKTCWPEIICIVLVNNDQSRNEKVSVGADLIVIKGLSGAKLVAEIKRLLPQKKT